MKTIGLIGGMSWESTIPYYRIINEVVREKLGGLHSAKIVLYSVDFDEIRRLQQTENWHEAGRILGQVAYSLQTVGAECIVVCTNTMHIVAADIEAAIQIPFIHIADPTAAEIKQLGLTKVGLLGTRFTMEQPFYKDRLRNMHHIDVLIPEEADRAVVHQVIFDELCAGQRRELSRRAYRRIIQDLVDRGAQGILLGCTEISLLIGAEDSPVPIFDTTSIHARKTAEWALNDATRTNHMPIWQAN